MTIPKELYQGNFTEFKESITILYLTDDRFKSLCDAYCSSKSDVEKYHIEMVKILTNTKKLENLIVGLQEEILIYLIRRNL
jgi:hypothetical protein